jgi:hypothetical protein
MKLLLESWREFLTEDWRDTSWEDDDEKITIGDVADHLGDETIDVIPSDVRDQVLKSRGKDRLPVGPGITSQDRIDKADLSFPIIITKKGGKFLDVLDGNHRLQRAVDEDVKSIKAKILDLDNTETPENFKKMFGGQDETPT